MGHPEPSTKATGLRKAKKKSKARTQDNMHMTAFSWGTLRSATQRHSPGVDEPSVLVCCIEQDTKNQESRKRKHTCILSRHNSLLNMDSLCQYVSHGTARESEQQKVFVKIIFGHRGRPMYTPTETVFSMPNLFLDLLPCPQSRYTLHLRPAVVSGLTSISPHHPCMITPLSPGYL